VLRQTLGEGGMGMVFEAEDAALRRLVAVKLLSPGQRRSAVGSARLLAEAQAMARLTHQNVVQVFDHGTDDRHGPYVVMERLTGQDLGFLVRSRGAWQVDAVRDLMRQLCSGLQAAHAHHILHRDLKPGNVFIVHPDQPGQKQIKILDFGLARLDGVGHLTAPGDLLGTLAYMPPERWVSSSAGDERSDVYGLGAVLYEVLRGAPPFRATRRAELMLAICHDLPDPVNLARTDVPHAWVEAIGTAMAKDPNHRFPTVRAFAEALGVADPGGQAQTISEATGGFAGNARYRVERLVGRTTTSEVYVAFDSLRRRRVAIKRVSPTDVEAMARLRREHKTLASLRHRHILRVEDIWEEAGHLVLVSELIEGPDVLAYLRTHPESLPKVFLGIGRALQQLHRRGLVHGDLKPSHVLLRRNGDAVLIDLGLARPFVGPRGGRDLPQGSLAYAAPEVLEGQIGPAADSYAVGVILWQALHDGALPARPENGGDTQVSSVSAGAGPTETRFAKPASLEKRGRRGAPKDSQDDAQAGTARLTALALSLMAARPEGRENAEALVRVCEATDARPVRPPNTSTEDMPVLIGRSSALTSLAAALARVPTQGPTVVWVSGASGVGKTALLDRFRRETESDGRTLVLAACARDTAGLPFPALDTAIDDLATWLDTLPDVFCDGLLPRGAAWLAQLFPGLRRVRRLAHRIASSDPDRVDQEHSRARAFSALRELMGRLSDHQRVVLVIDDAQWIDSDSAALLLHLLEEPEAPRLLVVAALRVDRAQGWVLPPAFERPPPGCVEHLHLAPLEEDDATHLLQERWRGARPLTEARARSLARASAGVPLLLELMAVASTEERGSGAPKRPQDDLSRLIQGRLRHLPALSRRAFSLLSLSTRPLSSDVLRLALGVRSSTALDHLLDARLVRASRSQRALLLEPAHSRLADSVRRRLTPKTRIRLHLVLAKALRTDPHTEPQHLVEQLAEAGEQGAAAEAALQGAGLAVRQLAFDRATVLYDLALAHGRYAPEERAEIHLQLARALEDAGQRRRSGEVLLRGAAVLPAGNLRDELEERAGIHLLLTGDVERGLAVLGPALTRHLWPLPTTTEAALAETLQALEGLLARGLTPSGRANTEPERALSLARVDLALACAQGLEHIDVRALLFAVRSLEAALDAGDPVRLQRAAAVFVIGTALSLPTPLIAPAFSLCKELTSQTDDPFAYGLLHAAEGQIAHFEGDFLTAEACFERAEHALTRSLTGATRELHAVRDTAVFLQYAHKGDFRSQIARTQAWLAEGEEADDLFHASMLRVAHAIVWIAHDQPEKAKRELEKSRHATTGVAGVLQVVATFYGDIVARYTEDEDALRHPPDSRARALASPAAQTPFLHGYLVLHEAWRALREAVAEGGLVDPLPAAGTVRAGLVSLRTSGLGLWDAVADTLEANLVFLEGRARGECEDVAPARLLIRAEQSFRRLNMPCLAACARKRRGELMRGQLGRRLEAEATTELGALGVVSPDKWTRAYWSMFSVVHPEAPAQGQGPSG